MKRGLDPHISSNKARKTSDNEEINNNNLSGPQSELEKLKKENEKMKSQIADLNMLVGSLYAKKKKYKQEVKKSELDLQSIRQQVKKVFGDYLYEINPSSPRSSANSGQGFHTSQDSVNNNNKNQPSPSSSPKNN